MDLSDFLFERWTEGFFIALIIIGFVLSVFIKSAFISYLIVFVAGLLAGRSIAVLIRKKNIFPYVLIILGFLIGYLIGSIAINISRVLIIIIFLIGSVLSYYICKKGYLK